MTVKEILEALGEVLEGGEEEVKRMVRFEDDETCRRIVASWPSEFDVSWAVKDLGFKVSRAAGEEENGTEAFAQKSIRRILIRALSLSTARLGRNQGSDPGVHRESEEHSRIRQRQGGQKGGGEARSAIRKDTVVSIAKTAFCLACPLKRTNHNV